jgi:hypothetical protein
MRPIIQSFTVIEPHCITYPYMQVGEIRCPSYGLDLTLINPLF